MAGATNRSRSGRHGRRALAAAITATFACGGRTSPAATVTWSGLGTGGWAEPADWVGGVVPGTTASATSFDVALFNSAGNGRTTVTVDLNRSIGGLTFDTANAAAYTFNGGPLVLSDGAVVQMTAAVARPQTINAALSLPYSYGTATLANNAATAAATLTVNGAVAPYVPANTGIVQPPSTLVLTGTNTGDNRLAGPVDDALVVSSGRTGIAGYTNLVKTGTGTWNLSGTQTLRGSTPTVVNAGTLVLSGSYNGSAGVYDYAALRVTGTVVQGPIVNQFGGSVLIDGNGRFAMPTGGGLYASGPVTVDNTATPISNRLNGNTVALNGGSLTYAGGGTGVTDAIGTLATPTGGNAITLTPTAGGRTVLTAATLAGPGTSGYGGTLTVTGTNLGGTPGGGTTNLLATTAGTAAGTAPVGGGGGPGTTTASILPFAVGRDLARSGNGQYGFLTGVGTANGLRVLDPATEYATTLATAGPAAAGQNVSLTTAANVSSAATANTLRLDAGGGVGGAGTLTVAGGAVLALPGNAGLSVGTLAFGSQPGVVTTVGNLTVAGTISAAAGLTKAGGGTLALSAPSTGYGRVSVNDGTLRLGRSVLPFDAVGPVALVGGSLDLNGQNQYLRLAGLGLAAGARSTVVNSSTATVNLYVLGAAGGSGSSGGTFAGTFGTAAGGNAFAVVADAGPGTTLGLSGTNRFTGGLTLRSGTVDLDFTLPTSPAADILPATTTLGLGGRLTLTASGAAATSQTLAATTVGPGATAVQLFPYGAGVITLNLGALTQTAGGAVNLDAGGAANGRFTTTRTNTNGILGGWATYNGTDWATSAATGTAAGAVTAATAYTADAWSAGANVTATRTATVTAATANSLRFAVPVTLTLGGTDTLTAGGVLVSSAVGSNPTRIAGGTLVPGAGRELTLNNWNPSGPLQVDATLADAAAGATTVTVAGYQTVLSGANTYTGPTRVEGGELVVSADANLGAPAAAAAVYLDQGTLSATTSFTLAADASGTGPRPVQVGNGGGTIAVAAGQTLTVAGPLKFTGFGGSTLTAAGPGTVRLTGGTSAVGHFVVTGGTLQFTQANDTLGDTIAVTGGAVAFGPGVGTYALGTVTAGTVNLADTAGLPVTAQLSAGPVVTGGFSGPGSIVTANYGTVTLAGANSYTGGTRLLSTNLTFATTAAVPPPTAGPINSSTGTVTFAASATPPALIGSGAVVVNVGATVTVPTIAANQATVDGTLVVTGIATGGSLSSVLAVAGAGQVTVGPADGSRVTLLQVGGLTRGNTIGRLAISPGSKVDVGNALLDVTADTLANVTALAARGFAGGTWFGPGLISSRAFGDRVRVTAVGVIPDTADGGTPLYATFGGLTTAATDVLVRATYYGDANLDGHVDAADYTRLDAGFLTGGTGWFNGDFNYDGRVDASDYTLADNAFNQQTGGFATPALAVARPTAAVAAVPEPAATAAIVTASILVGRRRRRRS